MSVQSVSLPANSSVASMGIVSAGHLTKDGMMLYLQTRLTGIDDQIQTKFDKQKKIEAIRKELNNIQNELAKLEDDTSNKSTIGAEPTPQVDRGSRSARNRHGGSRNGFAFVGTYNGRSPRSPVQDRIGPIDLAPQQKTQASYEVKIQKAIDNIAEHDPTLAATLRSDLRDEGQILDPKSGYLTKEVVATEELISNKIKQLESSAQLEMIELQSLMSARQTAIQLATNLVAALGESDKAIVGNVGR